VDPAAAALLAANSWDARMPDIEAALDDAWKSR
jgi:hypothetical protein